MFFHHPGVEFQESKYLLFHEIYWIDLFLIILKCMKTKMFWIKEAMDGRECKVCIK